MAHFLHVYIRRKAGATVPEEEALMNKGLDWYRYAPCCYLVHTKQTPERWRLRLAPIVERDGELLIFRVDVRDYSGWTSQPFWEWLKKRLSASA